MMSKQKPVVVSRKELLDRAAKHFDVSEAVSEVYTLRRAHFAERCNDVQLEAYAKENALLKADEVFDSILDDVPRWSLINANTTAVAPMPEGRQIRVEPTKYGAIITLLDTDGKRWTQEYRFPSHAFSPSGNLPQVDDVENNRADIDSDEWRK